MMIERWAHRSRACLSMDSLIVIADILAVSSRNNRRDRITGALVYSHGSFCQVIEGEVVDLERLMGRLSRDPRQTDIKIVLQHPVDKRLFEDWSMTAPKITPARQDEMSDAVEISDRDAETAVALLHRLAVEDAIHTPI